VTGESPDERPAGRWGLPDDDDGSALRSDGGSPETDAHDGDVNGTSADVDPDTDARRGEPLVRETDAGTRIWATGWYRVRPRTFVHHELFFDPDRIYCVYAEESYKSYLLRRSGREREAARVGRDYLDRTPDELLDHSRSFALDVDDVDEVRLRGGSLLFKPKLVVRTRDHSYEFYHWRRGQDVGALAATLREAYRFDVVEK
jgi:hypothetical protein